MRKHVTYANLVASIALFVALGGTGYAAVKISGKNIRNKSISGKKLKNRTITSGKLTRATVNSLRGATGPTGATGATGPSDVYSAFKEGVVAMPDATASKGVPTVTVASLDSLPPGNYWILAKMFLSDASGDSSVRCDLAAGQTSDIFVQGLTMAKQESALLNIPASFASEGRAVVRCSDYGGFSKASGLRITAIRTHSVRNLPSP